MKEELKKLKENSKYAVSNMGHVYYIKDGRKRLLRENSRGMVKLCIRTDEYNYLTVYRLVAKYFVPNPNNYGYVRHKDGNKKNNRYDNLYWSGGRNQKKVVFTNKDGEQKEYASMREAARCFGTTSQSLSSCIARNGFYKKHKVELKIE